MGAGGPSAGGSEQVGQVGAHVEQAGLRGRLCGAEWAQAAARPALGESSHDGDVVLVRTTGALG